MWGTNIDHMRGSEMLYYLTGSARTLPPHVQKATFLYFRDILDLLQELMGKVWSACGRAYARLRSSHAVVAGGL